jgi:type II secretory pathway pseudopilin PulG
MELIVVLGILAALAGLVVPLMNGVANDAQQTTTQATMKALREAVLAYYQDMKGIPLPRPLPGTSFTIDATGIPQSLKELQFLPSDVSGNPIQLDANGNSIQFNPATRRGWRGPYVVQATGRFASSPPLDASFYPAGNPYGNPGDPAFLDGWGNPVVLQWPSVGSSGVNDPNQDLAARVLNVRLVSAGAPSKTVQGTVVSVLDTLANVLMPTAAQRMDPTYPGGKDLVLFILTQDQFP